MPAETLHGIPDETVSCVICFHTLCSTRETYCALKEIKRVLKPNGKVYFIEHIRSKERFSSIWFLQMNFIPQ